MTENDSDEFDEEFESDPWGTLALLLICTAALPFNVLKNLWFLATGQKQKYRRIFDDIRVPGSEHFLPQ